MWLAAPASWSPWPKLCPGWPGPISSWAIRRLPSQRQRGRRNCRRIRQKSRPCGLLEGLALFELHRPDEAVSAFGDALAAADALLALADSNVAALQDRALALTGLAIGTVDPARATAAAQAFAYAHDVTSAEGVAADTGRLLTAIASHDRAGVLAEIRIGSLTGADAGPSSITTAPPPHRFTLEWLVQQLANIDAPAEVRAEVEQILRDVGDWPPQLAQAVRVLTRQVREYAYRPDLAQVFSALVRVTREQMDRPDG